MFRRRPLPSRSVCMPWSACISQYCLPWIGVEHLWQKLRQNWDGRRCDEEALEAFNMKCQCQILDIRWHGFITNSEVFSRTVDHEPSCLASSVKYLDTARFTNGVPSHDGLRCQVGLSSGRSLSREWRRSPGAHGPLGRPSQATSRGHERATIRQYRSDRGRLVPQHLGWPLRLSLATWPRRQRRRPLMAAAYNCSATEDHLWRSLQIYSTTSSLSPTVISFVCQ